MKVYNGIVQQLITVVGGAMGSGVNVKRYYNITAQTKKSKKKNRKSCLYYIML